MTFQGLVSDYFPFATIYGDGLQFVEEKVLPFVGEERGSELIKGDFGGLYKFCVDRKNKEEWIKDFKHEQPLYYTICCVVLYAYNKDITLVEKFDFSTVDIPIFFDEDPNWGNDRMKILEEKLKKPTVLSNKYFRLLLEDEEFAECS